MGTTWNWLSARNDSIWMSAAVAGVPVAGGASSVAVTLKVMFWFKATWAGVVVKLTWYLQSSSSPSALYRMGASSSGPASMSAPVVAGWQDAGLTAMGVTLALRSSTGPATAPPSAPAPPWPPPSLVLDELLQPARPAPPNASVETKDQKRARGIMKSLLAVNLPTAAAGSAVSNFRTRTHDARTVRLVNSYDTRVSSQTPPSDTMSDGASPAPVAAPVAAGKAGPGAGELWLTRFLLLRLLGLVYLMAFLTWVNQGPALVGAHGLLPASRELTGIAQELGGRAHGFAALPSLFWISDSDAVMFGAGWVGVALSVVVLAGYANALILLALFLLQVSLLPVGQLFYGFGWELQLCETGFLCLFLVP